MHYICLHLPIGPTCSIYLSTYLAISVSIVSKFDIHPSPTSVQTSSSTRVSAGTCKPEMSESLSLSLYLSIYLYRVNPRASARARARERERESERESERASERSLGASETRARVRERERDSASISSIYIST